MKTELDSTLLLEQRADPYVYRHSDGMYYFTGSVPAYDGIELRRSATIRGLAEASPVIIWKRHESGPMSEHIWAPELHYLDGKWYVYFAAGEREDIWKIRPYVLECAADDPLTGEWIERGMMQRAEGDPYSFTDFSLDATVFENRGKRYFVWAQKVGGEKGISNLYIAEMESPLKLKTIQVLLSTPDYDWERVDFWVNEGPAVLIRGGKVYIAYSASGTGACYCMGLLTASADADMLDPRSWSKSRYPVMVTDPECKLYGPGHNSFTLSEDGEDVVVFHARPYEKIEGNPLYDPNRHAMIMKLNWNGDGSPRFQ
ncbi:family 43 glycosylhydrolase [Gorillibacterium massiliense]|uniref:glycoside hydrolase family 43 protein n=1 Tax=Gorillibacterium massiliense TaxID=1280390 RepID=UPI0004B7AD45|nr:glycoside hydrolase family 43 protein [Gorillibacterium massiliense]